MTPLSGAAVTPRREVTRIRGAVSIWLLKVEHAVSRVIACLSLSTPPLHHAALAGHDRDRDAEHSLPRHRTSLAVSALRRLSHVLRSGKLSRPGKT